MIVTRDLFFLLKCRFLDTPKNLRRNKFINGNLKRKSVASCRKKIRNQIKFKYRQNRKDLYPIGKRKEIFIRYKSVFEFMLSIDSMSSTMIPVSSHPAPDTAKIWLIRSERDCYWLALNTASTMLRGVGKGESRWDEEGGPLEFSTLVKHRQTPSSRRYSKIRPRTGLEIPIPHPPPNLRPPKETGPPVFIRRRKLTLPKYVTGRNSYQVVSERKSVDARRV